MDAKQQKIIVSFLQKGYESIDQLVTISEASKGSIHSFCTSLVTAKIATQDKVSKKYSIKIDDESRNALLEYFLDHKLTSSELADKIKSQKDDKASFSTSQLIKPGTLGSLLGIFESQGFLHSYMTLTRDEKYELTRIGYSKQNACYVCHKKFNESDQTIVSQNTIFTDQYVIATADEDDPASDVYTRTILDNLLVHPRCAQTLTGAVESPSERSLCSFCGFPVSPMILKNKLIQNQLPQPSQFRRVIAKYCYSHHKIGFDHFYKNEAKVDFKQKYGIEIPEKLLEEINSVEQYYNFPVDRVMRKEIIEHATSIKSTDWYKNLKSHNFKARTTTGKGKTFSAPYRVADYVLGSHDFVTGSIITLDAVREVLVGAAKALPDNHELKAESENWHLECQAIYKQIENEMVRLKTTEEAFTEFFSHEIDQIYNAANFSGEHLRGELANWPESNIDETLDLSLLHKDKEGNLYHRECYTESLEIKKAELDVEILEKALKEAKNVEL